MNPHAVARCINRLTWETWLDAEESANLLDLPPEETDKVLRAGRRKGSITVRRDEDGKRRYMRVRLHPLPAQRLQAAT